LERVYTIKFKEGLSASMRWVIRRQIPTWYLYPRLGLFVLQTLDGLLSPQLNVAPSTPLEQVVLVYSLPVAGLEQVVLVYSVPVAGHF